MMRRKVILAAIFLIAIAGCLGFPLFIAPLSAQTTYTPDSKKVEAMVESAIKYLHTTSGSSERNCLVALSIVQASKRYLAAVPEGDPFVDKVVEDVRNSVNGGTLLNYKEVYYPCLALILLCEMDDVAYRPEIDKLIAAFEGQQLDDGGFAYRGQTTWDTSQTQFVALAYFVARQHRINVSVESSKRILEFMMAVQNKRTWFYNAADREARISIHAACAGTVYLLSDLLQLQPRVKKVEKRRVQGFGTELPPSISIFVPEVTTDGKPEGTGQWRGTGPLAKVNKRNLSEVKSKANAHFEQVFTFNVNKWPFYYYYALERYAYFREQAEGGVGNGSMRRWYDQGVEFFASIQKENGSFPAGPEPNSPANVNTAFAVMFLVRSSEILSLPPSSSSLAGGKDLASLTGQKLKQLRGGKIQSTETSQNLNELLDSLNQDLSGEQLAMLTDSLKSAIRDYQDRPETSRGEAQSFLRSLVKDKNYYKRLIAVRFLAAEQDLDNAPALIYAMGDPDIRICVEAHNGLRLISRKIDSIVLPEKPNRSDLVTAKEQWSSWYTKLRPGAELYD
jgi:hypothetical protein